MPVRGEGIQGGGWGSDIGWRRRRMFQGKTVLHAEGETVMIVCI